MIREVFIIKNITASEIELKDFGYIIPSGETVELQDFNKAVLSDELYNYLSGNTLVRIIDNNEVSFESSYDTTSNNYFEESYKEISVQKSGGTYSSIQAAIDSITGATTNNRYVINVGVGDYIEDIELKDYVIVHGISQSTVRIYGNLTIQSGSTGYCKIKDIQFMTYERPTSILNTSGIVVISDVTMNSIWSGDTQDKYVIGSQKGTIQIIGKTSLILTDTYLGTGYTTNYIYNLSGSDDINLSVISAIHLKNVYNDNSLLGVVYNTNSNSSSYIKIRNSITQTLFFGLNPTNSIYNAFHSGACGLTEFHNVSFEGNIVNSESATLKFITGYNAYSQDSGSTINITACKISWSNVINDSDIYISAAITDKDTVKVINTIYNTVSDIIPAVYTADGNSGFTYYSISNGVGTFFVNDKMVTNNLLIGGLESIVIDSVVDTLSGNSTSALVTENGIRNYVQNSVSEINFINTGWTNTTQTVEGFLNDMTEFLEQTNGSGVNGQYNLLFGAESNIVIVSGGTGYINYLHYHKNISWNYTEINVSGYSDNLYHVYVDSDSNINISSILPDKYQNIYIGMFYFSGGKIINIIDTSLKLNNSMNLALDSMANLGIFIYDNGGTVYALTANTLQIYSTACKAQFGFSKYDLSYIDSTAPNTLSFKFVFSYESSNNGFQLDFYRMQNSTKLGEIYTDRYNNPYGVADVPLTGITATFTTNSNIVTSSTNLTSILNDDYYIYLAPDSPLFMNPISSVTWNGSTTTITLESNYLGSGGTGIILYTNCLPKIPTNYYVKHLILRQLNDTIAFIPSQLTFSSESDAISGAYPPSPPNLEKFIIKLASIVAKQGDTTLNGKIYDIRPLPFFYSTVIGGGGGGVSSHSALSDLGNDDHPQYLRTDGTRNLTSIQRYSSHPSFTTITDIVDKKYVDDGLALKANISHNHITSNITDLSTYSGFTNYYLKTEINNFFSGSTPITGYNKDNWDTAYTNNHTHSNKTYLDAVGNNTIYHVSNINTSSINLVADKLTIHTQIGESSIISGGDNGNSSLFLDSTGGTFEINTYSSDNVYIATGGGNVAIGNPVFDVLNPERFLVRSYTETKNIISGYADNDDYIQLNIQNFNSGEFASSDLVATNDMGTETDMYVDVGINSSTYSDVDYSITDANGSYLIANGGNLSIGTSSTGMILKFFTNGSTAADEKMRITSDGSIIMQNDLTLSGITLLGDQTITGSLHVSGVTNLYNTVFIAGATTINNSLYTLSLNVDTDSVINGLLTVNDETHINNNLYVSGTLIVTGNTTHYSAVNINNILTAGYLSVTGNTVLGGTLRVSGSTNLVNILNVSGATTIYNSLTSNSAYINGNVDINGVLHTTGSTYFYDTLDVSGITSIYNNLNVSNDLKITGDSFITGSTHLGNVQSGFTQDNLDFTPSATPLETTNTTYTFINVYGVEAPDLSNVTQWTINWNLSSNSLYTFSINTNDGIPNWYVDLLSYSTQTFNQSYPSVTFSGVGITNLDGEYWVKKVSNNIMFISKTGNFTIYLSTTSVSYVPPTFISNFIAMDLYNRIVDTGIKAHLYGTEFHYVQSLTQTTTTSVTPTYHTKVTITTGIIPSGVYKITASYAMNKGVTNSDMLQRVQVDGTNLGGIHNHELSDTDTWLYNTRVMMITFSTTTTHTINLQFSQEAAGALNMRDCTLELIRVQ